jgi:hypothetical protein
MEKHMAKPYRYHDDSFWSSEEGKTVGVLLLILVAIVAFLVWYDMSARQEWEEYKSTHNCQPVGKIDGSVFTTVAPIVGGNGGVSIGVGAVPSKTGWKCDDGMTHWKND